jgi:tRNA 2-thiouridine synthesizing protein A
MDKQPNILNDLITDDLGEAEEAEEAEELRRAELIGDLERLGQLECMSCQRSLCSHAYVICVASGFKTTPRCVSCIADGYDRPHNEFLADAFRYVRRHPCYWSGWQWANQHEGHKQTLEHPACIWQDDNTPEEAVITDSREHTTETVPEPDAVWDAGDMSCGDLVLELRLRMKKLEAGQVMALTACDSGAPQDIPAWCRLTRHALIASQHPHYWIRRRAD